MTERFDCHYCKDSLNGKKYIQKDDHPCCVKCYEKFVANTCAECKRPIGCDTKELHHKGRYWHENCFQCYKCCRSLADESFGLQDERIICSKCSSRADSGACHGCKRAIRAGTKSVEYSGNHWHENCFSCSRCLQPLGSQSFIPKGDEVFCVTCHEKKFAKHCAGCRKAITSGGVSYKDQPWHSECFVCKTCRKPLSGQRFTAHEGSMYCVDCYSSFVAKKCAACHKAVTGFEGAQVVTFEDRQWHNECFICKKCSISLAEKRFINHNREVYCTDCGKTL